MKRTRTGAFALLGAACTSWGVAPVDMERFSDRGDPDQKWSQTIDCERECYFSNVNSNLSPYVRLDDFICTFTGDITEVTFWGGAFDLGTFQACPIDQNIRSFRVNIYEWIPDGECGWDRGPLLCSNSIPLGEVQIEPWCQGPNGEDYFQFRARLPEPCFQREGTRYGISIAAELINPDDPCIFHWAIAQEPRECPAFGFDADTGAVLCDPDDQAFELWTEPVTDDRKWEQLIDCDRECYFSNTNSALSPFIRFDDFLCTFTGDITQVTFWGGAFDLGTFQACPIDQNIRSFDINIYEWVPEGPCEWSRGPLLCSNTVQLSDMVIEQECLGPNGEEYYRFTASLPEPCFQREGTRYGISIAANLIEPEDPCIFHWAIAQQTRECPAYSFDRVNGELLCDPDDNAFVLWTEPVTDDRKWEQPINCDDQCYFSNLNSNIAPWVRYDDFLCTFTGPITTIEFWGGMWDFNAFGSCSLDRNLRGVDITIYEWLPDGECGWKFGERLCNTFVPIQDLEINQECPGPNGEEYFKFTAQLDDCFQQEGRRYAISVAGVLFNPDDPCVFHWALTDQPRECIAFGIDRIGGAIECGPNDHAFNLYTETTPCRPDWNGDTVLDIFDVLAFLGDFSSNLPSADYNGDTVLDIFDVLAFLGDFSTGC